MVGAGESIDLGLVAPHASRLLRIAPWRGDGPVLAGTDLSFSGGGVEVVEWRPGEREAAGRVATDWDYPCRVRVAFPREGGCAFASAVVPAGGGGFRAGV